MLLAILTALAAWGICTAHFLCSQRFVHNKLVDKVEELENTIKDLGDGNRDLKGMIGRNASDIHKIFEGVKYWKER